MTQPLANEAVLKQSPAAVPPEGRWGLRPTRGAAIAATFLAMTVRSPDGIMRVNSDGAIGVVNQAALDLLGCSADDLIGQPIGKFFADRQLPLPPGVETLGGQRP